MDLIAIDSSFNERFVFKSGNADFAVGSDENDFQLDFDLNIFDKMKSIKFLSIDKTEFGGKVNSYSIDTASGTASLKGKTWRGMLSEKIIVPAPNSDYLILSGEPYSIIERLINFTGLSDFFTVTHFASESISNFTFKRYCTLIEGITDVLNEIGFVLTLQYQNGAVELSAIKNDDIEIDNYDCDLSIQKNSCPVNHLVCLGKGELKERQVIHLYLQQDGTVGENQFYFGIDERTEVYDYSNVESAEELKNAGIEHLTELAKSEENFEMTLQNTDREIGQKIIAYEHFTGEKIVKKISKKVLTISKNNNSIQYEVRD